MRFIVVSCVYAPEPVVSAQTSEQIAHTLLAQGHEVSVIAAFPNRPAGKLYPGFGRAWSRRDHDRYGLPILRCFSTLSPHSRMVSRLLENVTFGLTSALALLLQRRPDVIYANTWPIFSQGLLQTVASARRIPVVLSIQDIYPESLVAQGRIAAKSKTARVLRWLDARIANAAAAVITISERFATVYTVSRGVPSERVHIVPNWIDERSVIPGEKIGEVRRRYGIPDDSFVVAYGGNVGMASGIETVIDAFGQLVGDQNMYLLVAGSGSQLGACQEKAAMLGNHRIIFHTPWLPHETSEVLSAADVLVLPTRGHQSMASVPSKLITYMLAGRPILALADDGSDLANTVSDAGCGWLMQPDDAPALARRIREVSRQPSEDLQRRGSAGRDYALKNLSRSANVTRAIDIIISAARGAVALF